MPAVVVACACGASPKAMRSVTHGHPTAIGCVAAFPAAVATVADRNRNLTLPLGAGLLRECDDRFSSKLGNQAIIACPQG